MIASAASALPNDDGLSVDVAGFALLYRAHYDAAHRWARALGSPADLAEDVVQDAFIVAFRRRESFDASRPFRAWLFGILRRVHSAHRRSSHRTRAREQRVNPPAPPPDPPEVLALTRARTLIDEFIRGIGDKQRLVFALCELEELSVPEAAGVLEIPVKTARARLRIARKKFARAVQQLRAREEMSDRET